MTKENINLVKNKVVKVEWYDACSKSASQDELTAINFIKDGKELLPINTTYGILYKKLTNVIIIITEESTSDKKDITIIPNVWVKKIKRIK